MTVHFLREHWAGPDTVVTESAMLLDSRLNIRREVDVTVEGTVDGEPLLISFEVIEHGRPASITWVEQIIAKHRYLPTNRLVLVSKSGFSANAQSAIDSQGGWVAGVSPEVVETDSGPAINELFLGTIQLQLMRASFDLVLEDGVEQPVVLPDTPIRSAEGEALGTALQLSQELLSLPWIGRHLLQTAYDHPERDSLTGASMGIVIGPLQMRALVDEHVQPLVHAVEIVARVDFKIQPLTLEIASFAGRRFASGKATMLGRDTVWVGTDGEDEGDQSKLSFRTLDSRPISATEPPRVEAIAEQLAKLDPPAEWVSEDDRGADEPTDDPGSLSPAG